MENSELAEISVEKSPLVLLAAGGTGGHIYPAIALSEALKQLAPEVRVQFVCGARPAERQIYQRQKIEPWVLPIGPQRRGIDAKVRSAGAQARAFSRARALLKAKPARVAVGFGSYVSVAPLLAARMYGAKIILHEQNVHRGLANRLLTPLATFIATADPLPSGTPSAQKFRHVGNPVRASFLQPVTRNAGRLFFQLHEDRPVCFVSGGSQGAIGVNRLVLDVLLRLQLHHSASRWQFLWATGPAQYEHVMREIQQGGIDPAAHSIHSYIDEMALAYAAADVVIARAGALTLAELTVLGKPAVLVPLPTSAHGHQLANARAMEQAGAARVLNERESGAAEKLERWLIEWTENPDELQKMAVASKKLGRPEAAENLARMVLELL